MKRFLLGALSMWLLMRWATYQRELAQIELALATVRAKLEFEKELRRPVDPILRSEGGYIFTYRGVSEHRGRRS